MSILANILDSRIHPYRDVFPLCYKTILNKPYDVNFGSVVLGVQKQEVIPTSSDLDEWSN